MFTASGGCHHIRGASKPGEQFLRMFAEDPVIKKLVNFAGQANTYAEAEVSSEAVLQKGQTTALPLSD